MRATSSSQDELEREALRLLAAASAEGVPLRLLGGMAIRLLLGERLEQPFRREIEDLDFITARRAGPAVERLLAAQGWTPERRFNAVNGRSRLLFQEPSGGRRIDVFVGSFRMCHALPLAERLEVREETLPAAELLLTKLQIVALNPKDRGDLYALLLACEVTEGEETGATGETAIDARRIAAVAAEDWGLQHTIELNLQRLRAGLSELAAEDEAAVLGGEQRERIGERLGALEAALEASPKSRGWRMRARVGERRRWYEDPEEIAR